MCRSIESGFPSFFSWIEETDVAASKRVLKQFVPSCSYYTRNSKSTDYQNRWYRLAIPE